MPLSIESPSSVLLAFQTMIPTHNQLVHVYVGSQSASRARVFVATTEMVCTDYCDLISGACNESVTFTDSSGAPPYTSPDESTLCNGEGWSVDTTSDVPLYIEVK